jgi:putative ABC transport system permease protein
MIADIRFALRQFAKSPGFVAVAVLTLALGIGANTAIFSVVNAVLLEPLRFPNSERLVQVCEMPAPGAYIPFASGGAFADWQDESTQLESIAAAHDVDENLTESGEPVRLKGSEVSADYLKVFGIRPLLGRDFLPSEDAAGGNHDVVIVSYELWQTHLGGVPSIVGRQIRLDDQALTVIGVLPPRALFPLAALGEPPNFLTPSVIRASAHHMNRDYNYVVGVTGRLKPGASRGQASEELAVARKAVKGLYPVFKQSWSVGMEPLHELIFGDMRPYVLTLLAAVGAVLLVACANVANLLLARATVRQSEIAVRMALGASPARIVRQLLTESLLLALIAGAAGLAIGAVSVHPLVVFSGIGDAVGGGIGLNVRVLGFTLVAACGTGVAFGIFPALSAVRSNLADPMKESARGSSAGSLRRARSLLLVAETAVTFLLLVCAGLLLRSFARAMSADPGFRPAGVVVFDLSVSNRKAPETADKVRLNQRLIERLQQVPGVAEVGVASTVPMNGGNNLGDLISREDRPESRNDYSAGFDSVAGDFFQAMGIPLVSGRFLTRQDDTAMAPKVMIINEMLAKTFFGKENPIGQRLHFKDAVWEIVGVVGDVRRYQLDYGATPQVYFALTYFPWRTCFVVRTRVPPQTVASEVRRAVSEVDPDLPIANLRTLDQAVDLTLKTRKVMLSLLALFAGTALALACVGIYGVISYSVAQRTRELGIRIALGASERHVTALVLGQSAVLVGAGLAAGLAGSLAGGSLIASQLYAVSKADPWVLGSVSGLLLLVSMLASWLPARRATRVNPVEALRAA